MLIRVIRFQLPLAPTTRVPNQAPETKPKENATLRLTVLRSNISPELTSILTLKSVHDVRVLGAVHVGQVPLRQVAVAVSPIRPWAMIVASEQKQLAPKLRRHEYLCRI